MLKNAFYDLERTFDFGGKLRHSILSRSSFRGVWYLPIPTHPYLPTTRENTWPVTVFHSTRRVKLRVGGSPGIRVRNSGRSVGYHGWAAVVGEGWEGVGLWGGGNIRKDPRSGMTAAKFTVSPLAAAIGRQLFFISSKSLTRENVLCGYRGCRSHYYESDDERYTTRPIRLGRPTATVTYTRNQRSENCILQNENDIA